MRDRYFLLSWIGCLVILIIGSFFLAKMGISPLGFFVWMILIDISLILFFTFMTNDEYDEKKFAECTCVNCGKSWKLTVNIKKNLLKCPYCNSKAFLIDTTKEYHDYT